MNKNLDLENQNLQKQIAEFRKGERLFQQVISIEQS